MHREQHHRTPGALCSVSQSAVSHAIARLRALFSDPLFGTHPGGQCSRPALADRLADPIGRALQSISDACRSTSASDPTAADLRFTIGTLHSISCRVPPAFGAEAPHRAVC